MFRRILVPLDGSAFGECALALAQQLAKPGVTRLLLVRVVRAVSPLNGQAGVVQQRVLAAGSYLQALAARLREGAPTSGRCSVETRVHVADPAVGILDLARTWRADLLILATHFRPAGWPSSPSVAADLLRHSSVPLLTFSCSAQSSFVPPTFHRLLVVGSASAEQPIPAPAADLAAAAGAEVVTRYHERAGVVAAHAGRGRTLAASERRSQAGKIVSAAQAAAADGIALIVQHDSRPGDAVVSCEVAQEVLQESHRLLLAIPTSASEDRRA